MGIGWSNILGVLVTHDHADHIRSVGTIGERCHVPIYATALVHGGIERNYGVRHKIKTARRTFQKGVPFQLGEFHINSFGISHDSTECVGFVIDWRDQRFMIATDCGQPSDELEEYLRTANHIIIEANHDEQLLLNGPYPTYLKQRILSNIGHQSNITCAELLERNYHPGMRNIWLCHLSKENNDPKLAYDTIAEHLREIGVEPAQDINLVVLDRLTPSVPFELN